MTNPVKRATLAAIVVFMASLVIWAMMPDLPAAIDQAWLPSTIGISAIVFVDKLAV